VENSIWKDKNKIEVEVGRIGREGELESKLE